MWLCEEASHVYLFHHLDWKSPSVVKCRQLQHDHPDILMEEDSQREEFVFLNFMEAYQQGGGEGRMGQKVQGIRSINGGRK